ncbi:hypothetical protein BH24ACI3_BH24ACI3_04610 [soil metagenome]
MPIVETEGLVLKSYDLSEADRIIVILTRDHGLIRGVAKGVKRLKSRFGSSLEPFSEVILEYFQRDDRELVTLQNVELRRSSFAAASDPEFLRVFSYLVDLLTSFVPPQDPNETIYRMFRVCIDAATERPEEMASIRLYFEIWILRLGGYLPDWSRCVSCKRELTETETTALDSDFGQLCLNCSKRGGDRAVSAGMRAHYLYIQEFPPLQYVSFAEPHPEMVRDLSAVLGRLIARSLEGGATVNRSLQTGITRK